MGTILFFVGVRLKNGQHHQPAITIVTEATKQPPSGLVEINEPLARLLPPALLSTIRHVASAGPGRGMMIVLWFVITSAHLIQRIPSTLPMLAM